MALRALLLTVLCVVVLERNNFDCAVAAVVVKGQ